MSWLQFFVFFFLKSLKFCTRCPANSLLSTHHLKGSCLCRFPPTRGSLRAGTASFYLGVRERADWASLVSLCFQLRSCLAQLQKHLKGANLTEDFMGKGLKAFKILLRHLLILFSRVLLSCQLSCLCCSLYFHIAEQSKRPTAIIA